MTREEIKTLARDLNYNVRFGGGDINGDAIQIENVLVALVRATLEEAARAVCPDCSVALAEQENVADATFLWVHTDRSADPWRSKACPAAPIYDLIANLDKEA